MSSAEVVGRILMPLIVKSSIPKGLKLAGAFGLILTFEIVPPALFAVASVNEVPGIDAVKNISPVEFPATAVTPRVVFALINVMSASLAACGEAGPAKLVKVVPLIVTEKVSVFAVSGNVLRYCY